ncbi:MAG: nucleotidyltransferase domain-containing protein [Bacteroidota bacterium]|nr:nucleotidyltransferase domain-containing protein [Bacteroidota bacterium]
MTALLKNNLDTIKDLCKKHHVNSLYVFGSAAREIDFNEKSDVDFLVTFNSLPVNTNEEVFYIADNYENLQKELQTIVNRKVDLIRENNIKNKFLKYFINKEKELLYGIS